MGNPPQSCTGNAKTCRNMPKQRIFKYTFCVPQAPLEVSSNIFKQKVQAQIQPAMKNKKK